MTVNGELVRRKTMAQRTPLPGFGSRRLRQELGAEGAWSQGAPYGLDGRHRGAQRWLPVASGAAGASVEAEWRGRGRASARGENGGGFSTAHPCMKIRPTNPHGVAATGAEVPHRRERGHRLVTGCIVGAHGTGYRSAR
jgi:hypothetical protein